MNKPLSSEEIVLLVDLIGRCEPGNLPSQVFESVARISVYTAVEFVLFRKINHSIETLLFPRSKNDPVWPGMLHTPGTVLRPTDNSFQDAIDRLLNDELVGLRVSKPHLVGTYFNQNARGSGIGVEYWLEVANNAGIGSFHNVKSLPDNFIPEQKQLLSRALESYLRFNNNLLI